MDVLLVSGAWRRAVRRLRKATAAMLGPVMAASAAALPALPATAVAAGVTAAVTAASVATASPAHAQSGEQVLVLLQNGESSAPEAALLQAAGYSVTTATPSVWAGMSTSQFEGYAALVIGDPSSGGSCSSLLPTTGTSGSDALGTAWQAAVNGNVAVLGTAPALPGTSASNALITDSAEYAAAGWNSSGSGGNTSGTGLYISLNCGYSTAAAGTDVSLLDGVEKIGTNGSVTVQGNLACTDPGTVNTWEAAKSGTFGGFTSSDLATSAWGTACPAEEAFGSWPAMFTPVAYDSAADVTDNFTASDGTAGQPYVLLGTPVSASTAALSPSVGGEVLSGTTSGGTSNPAAPGVDQASAGDPVNTENGDFTQSSTDFSLPGFGPALTFSRTYDANLAQQQTQTQTPGPMGYGWSDNWASSLLAARPTPGDIYAADGMRLDSGDGNPASSSLLDNPKGVFWNNTPGPDYGDVYIADTADNRIQEIPASNGEEWGITMTAGDIYTVAGQENGQEELPSFVGHGSGQPATSMVLNDPQGITLDPEGDLIIADDGFQDIVEIAATSHTQWGIPMTAGDAYVIAGHTGTQGTAGLGGPATSAYLEGPTSVHMGQGSGANDLYIADAAGNRILVIPGENESSEWGPSESWADGYLYDVAGDGVSNKCGNGASATGACLSGPEGVTINGTNMYIADTNNCRIVEVPATSTSSQWGISGNMTANDIYTVAGGSCGQDTSGGKAIGGDLSMPYSVRDPNGNLYIADYGNNDVVEVAGSGHSEWGQTMTGDYMYQIDSWTTPANPADLWVDSSGDIYVAIPGWEEVGELRAPSIVPVYQIAGGASGHNGGGSTNYLTLQDAGDGGAAVNASLLRPTVTATDSHGDVYIADEGNQRVQEIAAYSHTQFGIAMTAGDTYTIASGTGGAADTNPAAVLDEPAGLAVASSGNVYIADQGTDTVDVLDPAGNLSVFAGTGNSGAFTGNGTAAASATLGTPSAVAVDGAGDVFIADSGNNEVLEVPAATTSQMTAGDIYALAGASTTVPSGLSVTGTTTTTASLSWTASTGNVSGYAVYENGSATPVVTTTGTGTTATVTGLSPSTRYTFTVAAIGASGTAGSQSSSVTATTNMLPPAAPTGLTVTATTDASVSLSWTAPSGTVSGYNVYENGSSSPVTSSTTTSVSVTGLSASMTYSFTVEATNAGGSSTPSAPVSATTAPPPPAAPTGLTVTGTTSSSVSLSWTAPSGPVSGYDVYEITETIIGPVEEQLASFPGTGTTATVTGLSKSTSYTLNVAAYNVSGTGAYSTTVTARTGSTSPPGAPTGLKVTGTTSSSVSLSWTAPSGTVTGYYVYENGGASSVATSTSTSVTITGLTASTTYTFTVAAYNSGGTGTQSSSVSATTSAPPAAPAAPTGLTVTGSTDTSVSLSWTAPSGSVTGYYVYENGGTTSVATSTTTSVTVTGLSKSTGYTFTVAAYNSVGTGTPSSSVSATTTALPGTPAALTVTGTTSSSVSLSWTAPSGAVTGYYVYENGGTTSVATSTSTSVTVTGLTVSTTYTFTVAAYDTNGTGAPSSSVPATTASAAPGVPANLTATLDTDTSVTVSWTASTGPVAGYYVYEENCDNTGCNGTLTKVATVTSGTSITFTGLEDFDTYGFAVQAYNGSLTSAETSEVYVDTGSPLVVKASAGTLLTTPAGLSATPASATSVKLTWTKPSSTNFTGYYVYENRSEVSTIPLPDATAVTISGLAPGARYTFTIAEYDGSATSAQSAKATVALTASGAKTSNIVPLLESGGGDPSGSAGDNGPATAALLSDPAGLAVDSAGNIYISDTGNSQIREIAAVTGTQHGQAMTAGDIYDIAGGSTTTVTGTACPAYLYNQGDQGPAVCATLSGPQQIAVDQAGDVYVADSGDNAIREVPAASGTQWSQSMTSGDIYDIVGLDANQNGDTTIDGGPALTDYINMPYGIATDPSGDLYVLQQGGSTDGLLPQLQEIAATATPSLPPGTQETSSLYPLDTQGAAGGGLDIIQPGDSQVAFYAELPTGGCLDDYTLTDGYCLSSQEPSATLTTSNGNWIWTPTAGGDSYTYSQTTGQLTAETDPGGNTLSIQQDSPAPGTGACPSAATSCQIIQAATGRTLTIGYGATGAPGASGLITSVTDPMGRTWTYKYNSSDQLTSATDPMSNVTSYTYGPGSNTNQDLTNDLLTITSPNAQPNGPDAGDSTVNVYDELGRVITQTDPMGWKTTFNYCVNFYAGDCMDLISGSGYVTVTDPDNNKTVYQYQAGTLTAETRLTADTPTSEHDYQPLIQAGIAGGGTLLDSSETDGDGNTTTYGYDSDGDITAITSPGPDGPITETDSFTGQELVDCSSASVPSGSTTCAQAPGPAAMTPGGVITPPSSAPPEGVTWLLDDTDGEELYSTTGMYTPAGVLEFSRTTYNLFNGNTVTLNGTAISCTAGAPFRGLPCATIDADGVVTQLGYDSAGDLISSATPDGNGSEIATATYTYDADGEQTSATSPDGNISGANTGNYTTVTAYNADGKKATVTEAGGSGATMIPRVTTYSYDADGNQTAVKDARGDTSTMVYNADDQAAVSTDPDGDSALTCYDGDGHITQTVPPAGVAAGSLTAASCPSSYPSGYGLRLAADATAYTYDGDGDQVSVTTPAPAGQSGYETTSYTYDADGNMTTVTAPPTTNGGPNQVTVNTYNSAGYLIADTTGYGTAAAATTSYCYDAAGDRTSVVGPDGNTAGTAACETAAPWTVSASSNPAQAAYQTTNSYDSAGELLSTTSPPTSAAPGGATTTYTYDPAGNVLTVTDPDNITATSTYTSAGKVASVSYSGASAPSVVDTYDADGNNTGMTDATGTSSYTYDPFGELTSATNGGSITTSYGYDANGDVTSIAYPLPSTATWATSDVVTYAYNAADQMASVSDFTGNKSTFSYTPDGLPSTRSLGATGDTITTSYDNVGNPDAITLANSTSPLQSFNYSDAPAGNILTETDGPGSQSSAGYTYDAQGRIASMIPSGSSTAASYGFDASGNLTTLPAGAIATYNGGSELTSSTQSGDTTSYAYDASGNRLTSAQGASTITSATWNGAGRLTAYTNPSVTMNSATYDGDGMRASATFTPQGNSSPVTQHFVWDGDNLLMDSTNAYIYTNFSGGSQAAPLEQVNLSTGALTYLSADSLGSVRGTVSSSGALTATTSYDAWGNPQVTGGLTATTPFGFAGGYTDPDGLIYLINRYYDPETGQFTSVDPDVSQTLQPYAYTNGDPVDQADPTGLRPPPTTSSLVTSAKFQMALNYTVNLINHQMQTAVFHEIDKDYHSIWPWEKIAAYALMAGLFKTNHQWDEKVHLEPMLRKVPAENGEETSGRFGGLWARIGNQQVFYDIWGNIDYGYIGTVLGFTEFELQAGAEAAARSQHNGTDNYGNQIERQMGIGYYDYFGQYNNADDMEDYIFQNLSALQAQGGCSVLPFPATAKEGDACQNAYDFGAQVPV
jgi:RHS repeat-associated protein